MTVPDVILSPQILLLSVLTPEQFVLANLWICFLAGFFGLLRLKRQLGLSLLAFTLLFLLFNFNGHILAHITVGHLTWVAYFLFPWFISLIYELFDGRTGWRWTSRTAVLLFVLILQGGYHPFAWALMFMGILGLASTQYFWTLLRTALFAILLSAVRLLPPALMLGKFDNFYIGGYPLTISIWNNLVSHAIPNDITLSGGMTRSIGLWEFTTYIGLAGAIFLLFFGIFQSLRTHASEDPRLRLLIPIAGMAILSLGKFYQYLRIAIPIPLLTGERVASRIFIVAFVFLLVIAVRSFQSWMDSLKQAEWRKPLAALVLVVIANDLWQNFRLWRVVDASRQFTQTAIHPSRWTVANHADPAYTQVLWIGLAISLMSGLVLVYFTRREKPHFA
jgi:hypothetical protein